MLKCIGPVRAVDELNCTILHRTNHCLPNSFASGFQFRSDRSVAWRCDPMIVRLDAVSGSGNNSEQILFMTSFLIDGLYD